MAAKPSTFAEAERMDAYALAELWADRGRWSIRPRPVAEELAELAVMSALVAWAHRWRPIQVHRALLEGATVEQVTAAYGATADEVYEHWSTWVTSQRHLHQDGGQHGVSEEEYATVLAKFGGGAG